MSRQLQFKPRSAHISSTSGKTMANWQFLGARVTIFPGLPLDQKASQLFREIWSDEPESFQSAPGPLAPTSMASGTKLDAGVTITVQPGRVDLHVGSKSNQGLLNPNSYTSKAILDRAVSAAIEHLPKIPGGRIGYFLSIGNSFDTTAEANEAICALIDDAYRPPHLRLEEDFSLQVNKPQELFKDKWPIAEPNNTV